MRKSNLRYVDDATVMTSSEEELLQIISAVKMASKPWGLLLNVKKTKGMVADNNRADYSDFMLDCEKIEEVEEFIYTGSVITNQGGCRPEIKNV